MRFLYLLGTLFVLMGTIVLVDYHRFDFQTQEQALVQSCQKIGYCLPAFSFKNDAYREFVYAQ